MTWLLINITPSGEWRIRAAQMSMFDPEPVDLQRGKANKLRHTDYTGYRRWAKRNVRLPGHRIQWSRTATASEDASGGTLLVPATPVRG